MEVASRIHRRNRKVPFDLLLREDCGVVLGMLEVVGWVAGWLLYVRDGDFAVVIGSVGTAPAVHPW